MLAAGFDVHIGAAANSDVPDRELTVDDEDVLAEIRAIRWIAGAGAHVHEHRAGFVAVVIAERFIRDAPLRMAGPRHVFRFELVKIALHAPLHDFEHERLRRKTTRSRTFA